MLRPLPQRLEEQDRPQGGYQNLIEATAKKDLNYESKSIGLDTQPGYKHFSLFPRCKRPFDSQLDSHADVDGTKNPGYQPGLLLGNLVGAWNAGVW